MKLSTLSLVFILLFSTSCSLFVDEYQVNSRKVIAYLLEDLPLPDDADIIKVINKRIKLEKDKIAKEQELRIKTEALDEQNQTIDNVENQNIQSNEEQAGNQNISTNTT